MNNGRPTPKNESSRPHGNYSTHLAQLEPLIVEYLKRANSTWPFASAQDFLKALGFTRDESVNAINSLVGAGVIRFRIRSLHHAQPFNRVSLDLELVEQEGRE